MQCNNARVYVVILLKMESYTQVSPMVVVGVSLSTASSGRRSIILHRLMDQEALTLLFDGLEIIISLLDNKGLH